VTIPKEVEKYKKSYLKENTEKGNKRRKVYVRVLLYFILPNALFYLFFFSRGPEKQVKISIPALQTRPGFHLISLQAQVYVPWKKGPFWQNVAISNKTEGLYLGGAYLYHPERSASFDGDEAGGDGHQVSLQKVVLQIPATKTKYLQSKISSGVILNIFPEGTPSRTKKEQPYEFNY
jgi:hypothetical protein